MTEHKTHNHPHIGYHIGLWLLLGLLGLWCNHYLIGPPTVTGWLNYLLRYGLFLAAYLGYFYVFLKVIMVRLYDQKNWPNYLFWWMLILLVLNAGLIWIDFIFGFDEWMNETSFLSSNYLNVVLGPSFLLSLLALPFRLAADRSEGQRLQLQYKNQQVQAELKLLKAKLNPHFLLNTLNNIYSLIELKSPKAGPMILKLSSIMRYMLYETKGDQVPLTKELAYIQNYLDLQQLKKDGQYAIDFQIEGQPEGIQVEPMFFVPFFENCFKHGDLDALGAGWLKGKLSVKDSQLDFLLENTFNPEKRKDITPGISLDMVQQRLQLRYPNQHQLNITKESGLFRVHLALSLGTPKPLTQ